MSFHITASYLITSEGFLYYKNTYSKKKNSTKYKFYLISLEDGYTLKIL